MSDIWFGALRLPGCSITLPLYVGSNQVVTDVSCDVVECSWRRGAPRGGGYDAGTLTITLDNRSGRYTPTLDDMAVPPDGLQTGIPIVVTLAGVPMFTGIVSSWDQTFDTNPYTVTGYATDKGETLNVDRPELGFTVAANLPARNLVGEILNRAGWGSSYTITYGENTVLLQGSTLAQNLRTEMANAVGQWAISGLPQFAYVQGDNRFILTSGNGVRADFSRAYDVIDLVSPPAGVVPHPPVTLTHFDDCIGTAVSPAGDTYRVWSAIPFTSVIDAETVRNDVTLARKGGVPYHREDFTSIARYGRRTWERLDYLWTAAAEPEAISGFANVAAPRWAKAAPIVDRLNIDVVFNFVAMQKFLGQHWNLTQFGAALQAWDLGCYVEVKHTTKAIPAIPGTSSLRFSDATNSASTLDPALSLWYHALNTPGAGDYASTPDPPAPTPITTLDVRAQIRPNDWTPANFQAVIGQWTGGQQSYILTFENGRPTLFWSTDGATLPKWTATAPVPLADGTKAHLRAVMKVADTAATFGTAGTFGAGTFGGAGIVGAAVFSCTFYYSTEEAATPTTWTQLGDALAVAGTTAIFNGTAPLAVGGQTGAPGRNFLGKIYRASVRINGTLVADPDFSQRGIVIDPVAPTAWTLAGTATLALAEPADLDVRLWATIDDLSPATFAWLVSKYSGPVGNYEYALELGSGKQLRLWWSPDGTALLSATSAPLPFADGTKAHVRALLDVDNGAAGYTVRFYYSLDDALEPTWTQLGTPTTVAGTTRVFNGNLNLSIGQSPNTPAMDVHSMAVLRGDGAVVANPYWTNLYQNQAGPFLDSRGNSWTLTGGYIEGGATPAIAARTHRLRSRICAVDWQLTPDAIGVTLTLDESIV
jgi:hypothetical protein